jgi:hypothetical protein
MIKELIKYILNDFDEGSAERQPEKAVIFDIIEKMRIILFPEYYSESTVEYRLVQALEYVCADLKRQGLNGIRLLKTT